MEAIDEETFNSLFEIHAIWYYLAVPKGYVFQFSFLRFLLQAPSPGLSRACLSILFLRFLSFFPSSGSPTLATFNSLFEIRILEHCGKWKELNYLSILFLRFLMEVIYTCIIPSMAFNSLFEIPSSLLHSSSFSLMAKLSILFLRFDDVAWPSPLFPCSPLSILFLRFS